MKKFLYIFTFLLCFTFVSCNWNSKTENYSETGSVKINLSNSQRTVAPNVNWSLPNTTDSSAWKGWRFVFTNEKNETTEIEDRFPSDYQLIVGNYTLEVYGNIVQTSSGTGGTSFEGGTTTTGSSSDGDTTIGSSTTTTGTVSTGGTESIIGSSSSSSSNISLYGKSKTFTVSSDKEASVSVFISLSKFGAGAFDYTITLNSEILKDDDNPNFKITLTPLDGSATIEFNQTDSTIDLGMSTSSNNAQLYTYTYSNSKYELNLRADTISSGYYILSIDYINGTSLYKISLMDNLIEIADGLTTSGGPVSEISNHNRTYYVTDYESDGNGSLPYARINLIDLLNRLGNEDACISANINCDFKPDFDSQDFITAAQKINKSNLVINLQKKNSSECIQFGTITNGQVTKTPLSPTAENLSTFFDALPGNDVNDPYDIVITDTSVGLSDLHTALYAKEGFYINLDISNLPVTELPETAFQYTFSMIGIKLPINLTSMNYSAFESCTGLKTINLEETKVTNLPTNAFYDCSSLEQIVLPETVTTISMSAFGKCEALNQIIFPSSLEEISDKCFEGCISLKSITIPESVKILEGEIFSGSGIQSIEFKGVRLPAFSNSTFTGCSALISITIPAGASKPELEEFVPDSVNINYPLVTTTEFSTYLSSFTGDNNSAPYYFEFINTISDTDFSDILSALFNNETKYVYLNFSNCTGLKNQIEKDGAATTEDSFSGYSNLSGIVLPSSLTKVGAYCFYNSGLKEITIPATVTDIGDYAFANCTSLEKITFKREIPPSISSSAFDNILAYVYVPSGKASSYETALYITDSSTLEVHEY